MKRFLDWHKSDVCGVTVTPPEQVRSEVPRCYLDDYSKLITEIVPIVPAELTFNLGETGLPNWEDRQNEPVLGPTAEEATTLYHPINQLLRHHTLLYCVNASGDPYCPMLIVQNPGAR
jgi:hypothetical protein